MIEFYPQIKLVHIACALASVSLFALRGLFALGGWQKVAMWAPLRWLSYAIDTTLLSAALMLLTILPGALFANHWLTLKLVLLVVYVVLGSFALKRARSRLGRALCFVAALAVFGWIYGVARAHHPLGWWLLLGG
ncbi:MAG: SirB2 family protein [Lysobacteraceae bacterium]